MEVRPATLDDLPLIVDLQRRFDLAWFGKVEQGADEVREFLGYAEPLADASLMLLDAGRLVAFGLRFGQDTSFVNDPESDSAAVLAHMLPWFAQHPGAVEVIAREEAVIAGLEATGWTYHKSAYDLIADVTPDLVLAEPRWPEGVTVRHFDEADAAATSAKEERGRGLGRAMLLEALRRRVAGGATSLGLSVQATNRGALGLYLDVGLRVDREFRTYRAPTR